MLYHLPHQKLLASLENSSCIIMYKNLVQSSDTLVFNLKQNNTLKCFWNLKVIIERKKKTSFKSLSHPELTLTDPFATTIWFPSYSILIPSTWSVKHIALCREENKDSLHLFLGYFEFVWDYSTTFFLRTTVFNSVSWETSVSKHLTHSSLFFFHWCIMFNDKS